MQSIPAASLVGMKNRLGRDTRADLMVRKLNNRMAHLTDGRTSDPKMKLVEKDWDYLFKWLGMEFDAFQQAMSGKGLNVRKVAIDLADRAR